jgi:hypothetical protein
VVIAIVIPSFAALCIWQVHRALGGNQLSWAYVFEWPFFGGYAIYMWWRFIHEDAGDADTATMPSAAGAAMPPAAAAPAPAGTPDSAAAADDDGEGTGDAETDEQLAAYNTYLAELAARDKPKQWH